MTLIFANNAISKLAQPLLVGQTTLTVQTGTGALFPSPSGGDYFKLTVEDRRTQQIEIMHCIGRSGDVLTVERGQEDMTAQEFEVGATASNRFTRDTPDAILDEVPNANPLYLGAFSSPPTTDNNGDPLQVGMWYFNTNDGRVYYWTGGSWSDPLGSNNTTAAAGMYVLQDISGSFNGATTSFNLRYTDYAAATQTPDVTIAEQFIVWIDGVAQTPGVDYTIPVIGTISFTEAPTADASFHGVWAALRVDDRVQTPAIAAGVLTLDFVDGHAAEVPVDQNITSIVVDNWPAANSLAKMTIAFTNDGVGGHTISWPVGWRWANGSVPVFTTTALKTDIVVIMSVNGGTTIRATVAGQNY